MQREANVRHWAVRDRNKRNLQRTLIRSLTDYRNWREICSSSSYSSLLLKEEASRSSQETTVSRKASESHHQFRLAEGTICFYQLSSWVEHGDVWISIPNVGLGCTMFGYQFVTLLCDLLTSSFVGGLFGSGGVFHWLLPSLLGLSAFGMCLCLVLFFFVLDAYHLLLSPLIVWPISRTSRNLHWARPLWNPFIQLKAHFPP